MMETIFIDGNSGIPLIGLAYLGILTRNSNSLLQIRPITSCNMSCPFCSTDGGFRSKFKHNQFIVDCNYLLAWVKEVVDYYNEVDWAHIDSVGEPTLYKDLIKLIKGLKLIKGIKKVSMVTNGTLLKDKIKLLEEAGLDKINVSVHSLDKEKSKMLFGSEVYNINNVLKSLEELSKSKIDLWITPVYLPGVNDNDIEDIIKLVKKLKCNIGIQKYEIHKFGRKMDNVKKQNFDEFYEKLSYWENKYEIKLKFENIDIDISKVVKLPVKLRKNQKINVLV